MAKAIWEELEAAKTLLLHTIEAFEADEFNTVPFPGSWTAGQVAEHVLLSAAGGVQVLNGNGQATTRSPEEQVGPLRNLFLNFNIKMTSPQFIQPSDLPQDKQEILKRASDIFDSMITLAKKQDLALTYTDFEMPQFGMLTRLEWLSFILFHTQRHIRQLQNIQACFNKQVL